MDKMKCFMNSPYQFYILCPHNIDIIINSVCPDQVNNNNNIIIVLQDVMQLMIPKDNKFIQEP